MKFNVTFNVERCKGCEICVEFCPNKILWLDRNYLNQAGIHPAMITNQEECIGCTNCALMCPDAIISIEKIDA